MASDSDRDDDLVRLNAFVDGELAPAERAAVAARLAGDAAFAHAHATLAHLKACVHDGADDQRAPPLPPRKSLARRPAFGWAAAAVAVVAGVIAVTIGDRPADHSRPTLAPAAPVSLASLPSRPVVPRLDMAGLTLVDITVTAAGNAPTVAASYLGPHGCRLDLRAGPAGRNAPVIAGTGRHRWVVDDTAYELVAHGMPDWRFALLSEAAERQTRGGRLPHRMEQRLREARSAAPPCAG